MDSAQILNALERERELLEDFICLSEEQLILLQDEDLEGFDHLLQRRADLMMELTAIEGTLGTWITQIKSDPTVSPAMMKELRNVNDEIVRMANHIVHIDEQAHARLDLIKQRTRAELKNIEKGRHAMNGYASTYQQNSKLDIRG